MRTLPCAIILLVSIRALAENDVLSFRNGFGGHYPGATPPLFWSETENIAWKLPLPHGSNASPLIIGDKVFVLEEPDVLICLRKSDGVVLWKRNNLPEALWNRKTANESPPDWLSTYGFTTPTPVSDGKRIWCVFGFGVAACYDLDGKLQWASEFSVSDPISGVAVSPCLSGGALIVGGKGNDRLCAFDAKNGKRQWSTSEGAQEGSCVPVQIDGHDVIVASVGLIIDSRSGEILQRGLLGEPLRGQPHRQPINWGPTVVVENGAAVFHIHYQPDQICTALRAIKLGLRDSTPLWQNHVNGEGNLRGRMGNSPLIHDGLLYTVKDSGQLEVFDIYDGKRVYTQKLPKQSYASLAKAGDDIFSFGTSVVTVFKPGREYREVAQFNHGFRNFIASPVFQGRRMYFRDGSGLWCIEAPTDRAETNEAALPIHDDGPDLADTAKTAPLLSYSEWMVQYDSTRLRAKWISAMCQWIGAAVALGVAILIGRRRDVGTLFAVICLALLCSPLFLIHDRLGNTHLAAVAWLIAGGLFSMGYANKGLPTLQRMPLATCGAAVGTALGLLIHYAPFYALIVWQVMRAE